MLKKNKKTKLSLVVFYFFLSVWGKHNDGSVDLGGMNGKIYDWGALCEIPK